MNTPQNVDCVTVDIRSVDRYQYDAALYCTVLRCVLHH